MKLQQEISHVALDTAVHTHTLVQYSTSTNCSGIAAAGLNLSSIQEISIVDPELTSFIFGSVSQDFANYCRIRIWFLSQTQLLHNLHEKLCAYTLNLYILENF